LLVLGVFVTFVSTWFALNRFLRTNVDKLYWSWKIYSILASIQITIASF
jgi:undecaprenyl pyrophosphate phosphatase UppP